MSEPDRSEPGELRAIPGDSGRFGSILNFFDISARIGPEPRAPGPILRRGARKVTFRSSCVLKAPGEGAVILREFTGDSDPIRSDPAIPIRSDPIRSDPIRRDSGDSGRFGSILHFFDIPARFGPEPRAPGPNERPRARKVTFRSS